MRVVLVASAFVLIALSGCLSDDPKTAAASDGQSSCQASVNATAASITCTSSGNSTASQSATGSNSTPPSSTSDTTTSAGNATGNATGNSTGNATGNSTGNATGNQTASTHTPQHYEGEWPAGPFSCGVRPGARGSIYHDVFVVETDVEPGSIGATFTAVFAPTPGTQTVYVEFMDNAYARIGASATAAAAPWTVSGVVPEGAVSVRFTSCGAGGASVVYDAA